MPDLREALAGLFAEVGYNLTGIGHAELDFPYLHVEACDVEPCREGEVLNVVFDLMTFECHVIRLTDEKGEEKLLVKYAKRLEWSSSSSP